MSLLFKIFSWSNIKTLFRSNSWEKLILCSVITECCGVPIYMEFVFVNSSF